MRKVIFYNLLKCSLFGVVWFGIAMSVGMIITIIFNYSFKDVIFVEGIILIMLGVCGSIGGDPKGISLQGLGDVNAQYISNANLEITRAEREKNNYNLKILLIMSVSTFALITGGILTILTNIFI